MRGRSDEDKGEEWGSGGKKRGGEEGVQNSRKEEQRDTQPCSS